MKSKVKEPTNEEIRKERLKETWKNFIKFKIIELGIIPTGIAILYFLIPFLGRIGNKIYKFMGLPEDNVWGVGIFVLFVIIAFLFANFMIAKTFADNKMYEKYGSRSLYI